jgi:dTDP-glucose 4,6-dehydratase
MASLLVIGGSGFFGKSILDAYQHGLLSPWNIDSIDIVARSASSLQTAVPHLLNSSIRLHNEDIGTAKALPQADYVIHAAASTDASRYLSDGQVEKENILRATSNYCELAKQLNQNSKVVYTSSGAVYGQQSEHVLALSENADLEPVENLVPNKRGYAQAKRDGEALIRDLGKSGIKVSIARCFAFVGPYLPLDQHFAIGNFIKDSMRKEAITVKASHPVYRSYMYSEDLVRWLMTIAENATPDAPCFNVGSDEAISVLDLAKRVAARFGVPVNHPAQNKAPIDRYIPSIDKARKELGLTLHFNLDQAIDKTIKNLPAIAHV